MSAPTVKSVGKDLILYVPGRIVPAIMEILTVTVLTHFFCSAAIGQYDLTFRFILFLSTFTILWLNMAILRFYTAYTAKGQEREFFGVMGLLKYISIAVGCVLGLAGWLAGPDALFGSYRDFIPVGLLVFVAYSLYETGMTVLRAKLKPGVYSIGATLNAALRLPLAVGIIVGLGAGVEAMLWSMAICYCVTHAGIMRRHVGAPRLHFGPVERDLLSEVLWYGLPIWLTQVLNFLILNSDRYLLKVLQDDTQVGLYAVATNLVDRPMGLVFQTFAMAVFPSVAAAWETQGREHSEGLVRGITRIFLVLCVPMLVLLSVLAKPLFSVFAHGESQQAFIVAGWVAAGSFAYGLSYFASFGLHLSKKTHWLMAMTILALGANALLNYLIIPGRGFVGAGMARLASNAVLVVCLAVMGHRYFHWRFPVLSAIKCTGAALVAGLAAWTLARMLPPNLATLTLEFGLSAGVYGVLLVLTREVPLATLREGIDWGRRLLMR